MAKYGILLDVTKCTGCYSCYLACKDEYVNNDYPGFSVAQPEGQTWLRLSEVEQGSESKVKVDYIPIMCQHCNDAPCMKVAPEGAVYRRADGVIIIDPVKAKGYKKIVDACPYRAIYWNEGLNVAQKCTMCAQMIDAGEKETRCSEVCPTGALVFGDMADANSEISKLIKAKKDQVEDFKPQFETKPTVKYIGIPRPFIAGEIMLADNDECIKGAKVTLSCECGYKAEASTDFFGDFQFKGLESNVDYTLKAEYDGYYPVEMTVRTNAAKNVGEIVLQPK